MTGDRFHKNTDRVGPGRETRRDLSLARPEPRDLGLPHREYRFGAAHHEKAQERSQKNGNRERQSATQLLEARQAGSGSSPGPDAAPPAGRMSSMFLPCSSERQLFSCPMSTDSAMGLPH